MSYANKSPKDGEKKQLPSLLVGMQNSAATLEDSWRFLTKINILLPYDLAIAVLGSNPTELKIYIHTKTCTQMFIATLFIMDKMWAQTRCPSVGDG